MDPKREHIFYFDYLRIIAAISVIYMHVAALPLREGITMQWQMMNNVQALHLQLFLCFS